MSYNQRGSSGSGNREVINKVITLLVIVVVAVVLWQTGVLATMVNWVSGLYNKGSNAVTQSQQNFGATLARSRETQQQKEMGNR